MYVLVYRAAACTINNAEQNIGISWVNISTPAHKHYLCVCVFALLTLLHSTLYCKLSDWDVVLAN